MQAQRGSRAIALLILNLGARGGWVSNATPWPLYPQERGRYPQYSKGVGPRAGTDISGEQNMSYPSWFRTPNRPGHSESLFRLLQHRTPTERKSSLGGGEWGRHMKGHERRNLAKTAWQFAVNRKLADR